MYVTTFVAFLVMMTTVEVVSNYLGTQWQHTVRNYYDIIILEVFQHVLSSATPVSQSIL